MAKLLVTLAVLLCFSPMGPASAVEPADRDIAAAVSDIERFEREFGGVTQARAAAVARTKRLLSITRQRLDGSPNRDHESWIDADRRLVALLARLDALAGGGSVAAPSAGGTGAVPAAPSKTAATPAPAPRQMISQERVRITRLNRDIDSAIATLEEAGPKPFQDPAYVASREKKLDDLRQAFARFADFPDDPEVVAAGERLTRYDALMAAGREHAARERAELGDVQAILRATYERLTSTRVPEAPLAPYAEGAVGEWLVALARHRQAAAADAMALEPIRTRAYLPETRGTPEQGAAYDMQDLQRLQAGLLGDIRDVDEALRQFTADLDAQLGHVADDLAFFDGMDPHDEHDQMNLLLGQGQAEEMRARLAAIDALVRAAVDFDRLTGRTAPVDSTALLVRVQAAAAAYDAKRETALSVVRMPAAASTDPELLEIARQTISRPEYEAGKIERVVVNVDRRSFEMESSDVEFDRVDVGIGGSLKLSGTQTTYRYEWDQFQVATAEPVGDRHYIFYNTLKFYTSGAPTTPLGRWIVAKRLQSAEIPLANIPLD